MFNLQGKTALVTGASGGIGSAIAKALHQQGATVVLSGRRQDALDEVASSLQERVFTVLCDLSNTEQRGNLIEQSEQVCGNAIDILICNAGVTKDNLSMRMKDEEWDDVIDTNLTASFSLCKQAIKKMFRKKWGRIINITSVVGTTGNPGQANYAASKAGIVGFSKSMAIEAASRNITVNCIAPGFIKTAMTDVLTDDQKQSILGNIPAGILGTPEQIAAAAVYLASDESAYVTGQTLHVNGGMVMV